MFVETVVLLFARSSSVERLDEYSFAQFVVDIRNESENQSADVAVPISSAWSLLLCINQDENITDSDGFCIQGLAHLDRAAVRRYFCSNGRALMFE
jgi:hypothetical protein